MCYSQHKVHIYLEYTTVFVPSSESGPPSLSRKRVCSPQNQRGGGHIRQGVRGWGSQLGRLKKKPSTLSPMWHKASKRMEEKITLCRMCSSHFKNCVFANSFVDCTTAAPLHKHPPPHSNYIIHKHGHIIYVIIFCYHLLLSFPPFFLFLKTWHTRFFRKLFGVSLISSILPFLYSETKKISTEN